MARLGAVVAALQQPGVDLGVGAPMDCEQRLEYRRDRHLSTGRGDHAAGQPVAYPAAMVRGFRVVAGFRDIGKLGIGRLNRSR
jgi:hypothetical protein